MKKIVKKNKKMCLGILGIVLLVSAVTIVLLYAPSQLRCGIENCHGLDIKCGPNIPEACTAMYTSGDICRSFASCETVKGKCQLVESPAFDKCKACVEFCLEGFMDDPVGLSQCESECGEQ